MSRRGYSDVYEERDREYYEPSSRGRGGRTVYQEDIEEHVRRRPAEPEFLKEDYGRREAGPLVVREEIRERSRERPQRREVIEEDTVISRGTRTGLVREKS